MNYDIAKNQELSLRQLRGYAGLTQAEVAKEIGVCLSTYQKMERDVEYFRKCPINVLHKISKLYRISKDKIKIF